MTYTRVSKSLTALKHLHKNKSTLGNPGNQSRPSNNKYIKIRNQGMVRIDNVSKR